MEPATGGTRRALTIDNSPKARRTLVSYLSKLGFEVDQADSAAQGLERVKANAYDLVLVDLATPKIDAPALLSRLQAADGDLPVLGFRPPGPSTRREAPKWVVEVFTGQETRREQFGAVIGRLPRRRPAAAARRARAESEDMVTAIFDYLGGRKVFRSAVVKNRSDVHDLILRGLPAAALGHVVDAAEVLLPQEVSDAVGVSLRTVHRRRDAPRRPLSREQSDRAWQFAELMVSAIGIFGSQEEAERWFRLPAMALDQKRPLDLVTSSIGARMVEQLLIRIEHGVYT